MRNQSSGTIVLYTLAVALLVFGMWAVEVSSDTYNDNTSLTTKLNVSNVAPHILNVVVYKNGTAGGNNIVLEEGTMIDVRCNGTVNDTNGVADISSVNATIYQNGYSGSSDNNTKYDNASCVEVSQLDDLSAYYTCHFKVWFFANNGTWTCNMSALDTGGLLNSTTDTNDIDPLYAINITTDEIDFGELDPNQESGSDETVSLTNFGNMNLSISLKSYADNDGDNQAMNCTVNNISLNYERYSLSAAQAWSGMTAVQGSFATIAGLTILQRLDDADASNSKTTNTTYWKIKAPLGTRGVCNGTVVFSAEGN